MAVAVCLAVIDLSMSRYEIVAVSGEKTRRDTQKVRLGEIRRGLVAD